MDSFGINSIKSCGVYLDIQMISNQKSFNYKVVDLVEYYNFDIKFVFIRRHIRKLWSFLAYHCRFKPRTDSHSISVGFSQKPTMMTQYFRCMVETWWQSSCEIRIELILFFMGPTYQWKHSTSFSSLSGHKWRITDLFPSWTAPCWHREN